MKTLFKPFIVLAVAAMTFGSCAKDKSEDTATAGHYRMTFTANAENTRTTLGPGDVIKWVEKDIAGVFVSTTSINRQATVDVTKDPVEFSVTLSAIPAAGDMLYAYYPYNGSAGNDLNAIKSSIPTTQTQSEAGVFAGSNNPLAGIPVTLEAGTSTSLTMPRVLFRQLGSIVEFGVMSTEPTYAAEQVRSITFSADKAMAGDFTFDITAVSNDAEPVISGYQAAAVTTAMTTPAALGTSKETASKIYMVVAPGQYTGKIEVTTDAAVYVYKITSATDFKRATIKEFTVDLKNAVNRIPFESASLTKETIKANFEKQGYNDLATSYTDAVNGITYIFKGFREADNSEYFQIKAGDFYVEINAANNLKQVVAGVKSATDGTFTGTLSLKAGGTSGATVASGSPVNGFVSFTIPDEHTDLFLVADGSTRIYSIDLKTAPSTDPKILAPDNIAVAAVGTQDGESSYTLANTEVGVDVTATCSGCVAAVEAGGGLIMYSVDPNHTEAEKTGSILLTYNGDTSVTKTIVVTQAAAVFTSTITEAILQGPANSTKTFTVTSDFPWTIDASGLTGFTVSPTVSATGSNKTTVTLTTTAENADPDIKTLGAFDIIRTFDSKKLNVVVKQESAAVKTAVLPFSFNGKKADALKLDGVSLSTGSDYSSSPYLKFDSEGAYFQVNFDVAAGSVSFNTKQNGTNSTNVITVQGSSDGTTFTDIESFTINQGNTKTKVYTTTNAIDGTFRYIKIIATTKVSGTNIAVGSIAIAKAN